MEMIVPLLEGQTIFINNDEESEDEWYGRSDHSFNILDEADCQVWTYF